MYRVYEPDPHSELVLSSNLVKREDILLKEEMVTGVCPLTSLPFDNTTIVASSYDNFLLIKWKEIFLIIRVCGQFAQWDQTFDYYFIKYTNVL